MSFIGIYVTHPNGECAQKISTDLLSKKFIACYNLFPIQSAYWWNGHIENTGEIVTLYKTRTDNWEKVKTEILAQHPYVTPCIIKLIMEANEEYEQWIKKETT